jgi:predicted DNA-binding protein
MKLKTLLEGKDTLEKLYSATVDGKTAYQIRKAIKQFNEELETFNQLKDDFIEQHGKENKNKILSIQPDSEEYPKFVEYLNEAVEQEIKDAPFQLDQNVLNGVKLSAKELDLLINMNLIKED